MQPELFYMYLLCMCLYVFVYAHAHRTCTPACTYTSYFPDSVVNPSGEHPDSTSHFSLARAGVFASSPGPLENPSSTQQPLLGRWLVVTCEACLTSPWPPLSLLTSGLTLSQLFYIYIYSSSVLTDLSLRSPFLTTI